MRISKQSARYLLEVTDGLSIKVDHPHAIPAMQVAVRARAELRAVVNAEEEISDEEVQDEDEE